jgi:acyl carrier protein
MEPLSTLHQIVASVLRIPADEIGPDATMDTVDTWNSLTHIEFVTTLEERFAIQLTDDEIAGMTSLGQVQRVLRERGVLAP